MSQSQGHRPSRDAAPLYEPRFEHDACGVGFVADAGGRSLDRVLPLALAGLAALAHRGAFGADGESSDGAGVALPLDRSVLAFLAGDAAAARPGIVSLFLPRGRAAERAARALVEATFEAAGLAIVGWRSVPVEVDALGAAAAESRPAFAQAIVERPSRGADDPRPVSDDAFERRLVVARRRLETAARAAGGRLAELSVPSASARTIVYKGLVSGGRLPELYPDLRAGWAVGYAVFHQRYATNTQPVWRLAQPFRSIAHNGEINTVRANREQVRGRTADPAATGIARDLLAAGPLLAADGSDSLSLDEALELLTTTGWDLASALLTTIPEAMALRRAPHPLVATLRRRTAGLPRPVGRPGRDRVRRRAAGRRAGRSERAAPGGVRRDPRPARRRGVRGGRRAVQRGRDRPARPARAGRAAAGRAGSPGDPRGHRGEGPGPSPAAGPRRPAADLRRPAGRGGRARHRRSRRAPIIACATSPGSMPSAPGSTSRRWRSRVTSRCGAWATTRRPRVVPASTGRSPTTSGRRSRRSPTRRSIPSGSGSSWTSGSSSAAGRRCSAVRPAPRARCGSSARSSSTSMGSSRRPARATGRAGASGRSMRPGIRPRDPRGWRQRSTGWRRRPSPPPDATRRCSS